MPEAGQLVQAEQAREALFASITPWLDSLAPEIPPEAGQLRPLVALQLHPTMGRLILVSEQTGTMAEVARATEADLPAAADVAAAVEQFIAAGLSAMPATVAEAAFGHAAKAGAGFMVLLDPMAGSARCVFAPRGAGLDRAIELFGISPEKVETTH
jgi:hypothetical protein